MTDLYVKIYDAAHAELWKINAFMCTYNPSESQGQRLFLTSTLSSIGHKRMDVEAMQVQGCGATPGTETWSDHCFGWRTDRLKSKAVISPVFTGMRLLYLMLVVMMPALHPRLYPKRRLSDSGPPLLQSTDRRLEGAGSADRQAPPPNGYSQSQLGIYLQGVLADANRSSSDWFSLKNPEVSILRFQLVYSAYKTQTQMLFVLSFISEIKKKDALKSSLWNVLPHSDPI